MKWLKLFPISLLLGLSMSGLIPVSKPQALNPFDYFTISYSTTISRTQVIPTQSFDITVTGIAVCIQDLPFTPSDAVVTGRIVAEHESGDQFIIASSYTVSMSGFPTKSGESIQASENVRVTLPANSPLGTYKLRGELIEAKVKAVVWFNVNSYLPAQENFGSIKLINQANPPIPPPVEDPLPILPSSTPPLPTIAPEPPPSGQNPPSLPAAAVFSVSNLSLSSVSVFTGSPVTITAVLTNTGNIADNYRLELLVNGTPNSVQTITLNPGESRSVEFILTPETSGVFQVKLMNLTTSFAVSDAPVKNSPPPQADTDSLPEFPEKPKTNDTSLFMVLGSNILLISFIIWFILRQRRNVHK